MKRARLFLVLSWFILSGAAAAADNVLDVYQTGNNTGAQGVAWRWDNIRAGTNIMIDGVSSLHIPMSVAWNQYLDTPVPTSLADKNLALVFIFSKSADGEIALGFARGTGWGEGFSPQQQRVFKLKGKRIFISQNHVPTDTDEDTNAQITAYAQQGLMMKVDTAGNVRYFYQNGVDINCDSPAWKDITPATSAAGNLTNFDAGLTMIGVNTCGKGDGTLSLDYIGLIETGASPKILLADHFEGREPGELQRVLALRGDHPEEDYYDRSLPTEIPVKRYEGKRYEAVVPDTEDLVDYANRGLIAATGMVSPQEEYMAPQLMYYGMNPPVMQMRDGAFVNTTSKWVEALPLLRVMTGNNDNLEIDGKIIASLVRYTGKDGLVYQPVENRPWAYFDPMTKSIGKPFSDIFGEARQARAYAMWYQHDRNPLWKKLAQRKIKRMLELSIRKDDGRYLSAGRGYSPWYKETGTGPIIAVGDAGAVYSGMTGTAAAHVQCWWAHAGATWYRLDGDKEALELAGGLTRYLRRHGQVLEDNTGRPLIGLDGYLSHSLLGTLLYALTVQDHDTIKWVKTAFGPYFLMQDPDHTGVVRNLKGCLEDMIQMGTLLSQAGYGNYWEDVDRWIRNSLLISQVFEADAEMVKQQPYVPMTDPDYKWDKFIPMQFVKYSAEHQEGLYHPEGGVDACVGGFVPVFFGRGACTGDCTTNRLRSLYTIWDSILEAKDDQLKINLLFNRASAQADIDSYIPYEGKVVVSMKAPCQEVLVRIPEWTDWNEVSCQINGKDRPVRWSAQQVGYVSLAKVKAKDRIVLTFPMKQWEVTTDFGIKSDPAKTCKVTLKGNTVIETSEDIGYPAFFLARFRGDKCPMKKVERFVSKERFIW